VALLEQTRPARRERGRKTNKARRRGEEGQESTEKAMAMVRSAMARVARSYQPASLPARATSELSLPSAGCRRPAADHMTKRYLSNGKVNPKLGCSILLLTFHLSRTVEWCETNERLILCLWCCQTSGKTLCSEPNIKKLTMLVIR
jgi:hypothetical protein